MEIIENIYTTTQQKPTILTVGTFDGVHTAHKNIIQKIKEQAQLKNYKSLIITFYPHPQTILKGTPIKCLTTFEEKAKLIQEIGIDAIVKLPFTKELSEMSSETFIQEILVNALSTKKIIIGYDHRFGKNKEGNIELLKKKGELYGFEVEEISKIEIEKQTISSTQIRKALSEGNITTANQLLGRNYTIQGTIIHGDKIAKTLGYPTANIQIHNPEKLIPMHGIYLVKTSVKHKKYFGMLYHGNNQTTNHTKEKIEVNIFQFSENIYGEHIEVEFLHFIRHDKKFESITLLQKQIQNDEQTARQIIQKYT